MSETKTTSMAGSFDHNAPWYRYSRHATTQGYCLLLVGRSVVLLSNVFLSLSLVYLASKQAGCLDEEEEIVSDCRNKVYGFYPAALVANIGVISGLLSAFLMPIIGAMVDYTSYRKVLGVASAMLLIAIQAAQVYTVESTWFIMSILQSLAAFLFFVQVLTCYGYLHEMRHDLGEAMTSQHMGTMLALQAGASLLFLLTVVVVASGALLGLDDSDVKTAHFSQGLSTVVGGLLLGLGWQKKGSRPPCHALPEGRSIFTQGFRQVYETMQMVHAKYRKGLFLYYFSLAFAEAGVGAIFSLAVTYFDEHLGFTASEVGVVIFIFLTVMIPGTFFSTWVTSITNPNRCYQLSMVYTALVVIVGTLIIDYTPKYMGFVWAGFVGFGLGWFYPVETLVYSSMTPPGYDAALAGVFVYFNQILAWAAPLLYSLTVGWGVRRTYGMMSVAIFIMIAVIISCQSGPWEEISAPKERHGGKVVVQKGNDHNNENGPLSTTREFSRSIAASAQAEESASITSA